MDTLPVRQFVVSLVAGLPSLSVLLPKAHPLSPPFSWVLPAGSSLRYSLLLFPTSALGSSGSRWGGTTFVHLLVSLSNPSQTSALAKDDTSVPRLPIAVQVLEVSGHSLPVLSLPQPVLVSGHTRAALRLFVSLRAPILQMAKAAFSERCRTLRTFPLVALPALLDPSSH